VLLMLQDHHTVEAETGGEYRFQAPITYRDGGIVPEIRLKVWSESGRVFVEAITPIKELALSTLMPRGFRIPWFGRRDFRLILPWSSWSTDVPNRVTSYCRAFEVLQPGRKVELSMNERLHPRISIDGTNFEIHWEVKVGKRTRVLFLNESWEYPRTAVSTE
jgi:hypothetical protein